MGTWSVAAFGNDDAADWAYALEDADNLAPIEQAISTIIGAGEAYVEAPEATEAIAAIELLACLLGKPGDTGTYTEAVDAWLKRVELEPGPEWVDRAHQVLARILGEDSELHELWRESEDYEQRLAAMADLRSRVGA